MLETGCITEIVKTCGDPDKLGVKCRRMKDPVHTGLTHLFEDKRIMCLNISFIFREMHTWIG